MEDVCREKGPRSLTREETRAVLTPTIFETRTTVPKDIQDKPHQRDVSVKTFICKNVKRIKLTQCTKENHGSHHIHHRPILPFTCLISTSILQFNRLND